MFTGYKCPFRPIYFILFQIHNSFHVFLPFLTHPSHSHINLFLLSHSILCSSSINLEAFSKPYPPLTPLPDYTIPDPPLSELGHEQCRKLQQALKQLPLANEVELIVVSPFRRTLQTALEGLEWLVERGVEVRPDAEWQGELLFVLLFLF